MFIFFITRIQVPHSTNLREYSLTALQIFCTKRIQFNRESQGKMLSRYNGCSNDCDTRARYGTCVTFSRQCVFVRYKLTTVTQHFSVRALYERKFENAYIILYYTTQKSHLSCFYPQRIFTRISSLQK